MALGLLAVREHSRAELAHKLNVRGFSDDQVAPMLADLDSHGLVDDARMAEAYATQRIEKGFGPLRVRQELRERGVADALIHPHLDRTPGEWLQRLTLAHDKKFGADRATDAKERGRRARFLEHRGFPSDLIGRLLHGDEEI